MYVYLGSIGLVTALNMSGETVWRQDIGAFETTGGFGSAASPVLHDDRLYIVNDNTTRSFMVAIDTHTGEELWRVDRDERGQNWATPFVWENALRTELVTSGTGGIRSYDLDGELLWEIHGMSGLTIPHAVLQARTHLPQLRVSGRWVETCLRRPTRRVRRHFSLAI